MQQISKVIDLLAPFAPFDAIGVGVIDFNKESFEIYEKGGKQIFFDLASVTKPLTNSLMYFKKSEAFSKDILLCLNHRGGLPAWGLLSEKTWRSQILNYSIEESETLYSDFSALRVMLELKKIKINPYHECKKTWDKETVFWKDLPADANLVQTGYKGGEPNFGKVHDPNAFVIDEFCSHAGLFSTTRGLCQTLLNYEKETHFIQKVFNDLKTHSHRFSFGWDRVVNPLDTLAGSGCSPFTFGHLGFTGTSVWIDPEKRKGHIILTNTVKYHWYNKKDLNEIRKAVGQVVWSE